ncbi:MAG: Ig-like domain-containing protein [Acidimicrobiales bacterium]
MRSKYVAAGACAIFAVLGLMAQLVFPALADAATVQLGVTTAGPSVDSHDANHLNGSRFTTGAVGGTVTSMSVFVAGVGAAPNNGYQLGIYTDAAGRPGTLLARSATGTLVANSLNTLPVSATLAANTPYWLMYNANGASTSLNNMRYASGGTSGWSSGTVPFGTWPATFGASATASMTFSISASYTTPDTVPAPTAVISAPTAGATVSGTALTVSANATNAVGVQFRVGATNIGAEDTTAPYSTVWDSTTVANGTHNLTAVARNSAGQTVTSAAVAVSVQNAAPPPPPPTVSITAPTAAATVSGATVAVTANATNAAGVQFKVNGVNLGAEDTVAPYSATWDSTTVANGTHAVSAEARNSAGAIATASVSVTVSNAAPPPPPPPSTTQPVLVITNPAATFTRFYAEILDAEGIRSYTTRDLSTVDATVLGQFDVALLSEGALTDAQAAMFTTWVNGGGNLVAMRPDKRLAPLLGLTDAGTTLADAYLRIDTTTPAGTGLVGETIQYHGTADRYTNASATVLASLHTTATTATTNPAVTLRNVGASGGKAAAFTFDLARSVVLTRQGNPAWTGRNVDGVDGIQASEMFFGANGAPDWNNLDKALIPIADEQQRLLVNVITAMASARKPLPRLWYLPRQLKAAIVMTGDDHSTSGTAARFNEYLARSPAGCNLANWECVRSSSYIFPYANNLTNAQAVAYTNQGFEVGFHADTFCQPWGAAQNLYNLYTSQLSMWRNLYPTVPASVSTRSHCVEWDDWATHARVKLANGMRLDTDYYYYPASWTAGRPGYFNGTAMPMRYADLDGSIIDVYQATTQISDESGHTQPAAVNAMLDRALGAEGFYSVITANMHTDSTSGTAAAQSVEVVASAQARGVPIVSGRQMLSWLDARNASGFGTISWSGSALSFNVTGGATGLTGMLPTASAAGTLGAISRDGTSVPFTVSTVKGVSYAMFSATVGGYTATYGTGTGGGGGGGGGGGDTVAPTVTSTAPAAGETNVAVGSAVRFTFSEDLNAASVTSTSAELRNPAGTLVAATVSYNSASRSVVLVPTAVLAASTTYTATMRAGGARDLAGLALAADRTITFTTAAAPPPPPPPPTGGPLGNTAIGVSTDTFNNNSMHGIRVVAGASNQTVNTMFAYVKGTVSAAPNNRFRVAIYTDAGGVPGTLVAQSAEGTLVANSWNSVAVSATLTANTAYWFIYNSNGTAATHNGLAYDVAAAGSGGWSSGSVPYGTWPASFGGFTSSAARYSLYAQ